MDSLKEEESSEAVSPMGQYFNCSVLSLHILAVLEFEVSIHDLPVASLLQHLFLPINPRFSSIMVNDQSGKKRWKQVEVKLEEHIVVPTFSAGMSLDSHDMCFNDYLSKVAMQQLPQTKPLWEVHVIKYPKSNAAGALIFKLHHALGDGYSLMGALLSCLRRADDPSLPLTLPSRRRSKSDFNNRSVFMRLPWLVSSFFYSIADFGCSLLKSSVVEDDKTPIRSGDERLDLFRPTTISSMEFSIDPVKEIKSMLGVSTNDVITGIISYGIRLYMQDIDYRSSTANSTLLLLLNTRNVEGYQSLEDMLKSNAWGNRISFLHIAVPKLKDGQISNPLQFIWKAHTAIKRKRHSFTVFLTGWLLQMMHKFRGHEGVAKHMINTVRKSSAVFSNMVGPVEQMTLASHPINGFYFTLAGGPESLGISITSYMGVLRVTIKTGEGLINEQRLMARMKDAFEILLKAAREIRNRSKP